MNINFKKILCTLTSTVLIMSFASIQAISADKETVLAKFFYEQQNTSDDSLNVTYGGSADEGYGATTGIFKDSSVLYASTNGISSKKLEWSNYDGADGNDYSDSADELIGAVPVMAAGGKNPWGDASVTPAYFEIVTSTAGYEDITFSADLGGSKKGAKNFKLSYSINGTDFTDVSDTVYSISKNKTMQKLFDNVPLPGTVYDADKLYLKIYAADNAAISGDLLSDNPTGGENAINNIRIKGTPLSGKSVWQPDLEFTSAKLENDLLSIEMKNVSEETASAVNIVCLYKNLQIERIITDEINNVAANKRHISEYDVKDIDFDSVRVFMWNNLSDIMPVGAAPIFTKEEIIPTPTPEPTPTPNPYSNEPAYKDIPEVHIDGDIEGISREVTKDVTLTYKSSTEEFISYATVKWQGRSSVTQGYPKYNYSLKMYSDEGRSVKDKHQFKTWLPAYNYCLKANWMDSTHARNIVNARLAANIQKTSLPTGATGLIDGFPIHVYLNGEDQGVYTWNIPKKGWTFGMDSDNPNHIVFGAEEQSGACLFQEESRSDSDWELVYPDPEESPDARNKLNRLIRFVKDSSVEKFKANFDDYLDFDATVNYYVFAHRIGHTDGFAKNMLLATFDGEVWYPSLYDMDSTWGLHWKGDKLVSADVLYNPQSTEKGYVYSISELWSKFEQAFGNEIYERYIELRNNELTDEKIIAEFEYFMNGIGQDLYDLDDQVWTGKDGRHWCIPSRNYRLEQIKQFMQDRQPYTDAWMEGLRTE